MTDQQKSQIQQIAESDDDDRVRIELRPDPDGDGYELIMTNASGTQAWQIPYDQAGQLIDALSIATTPNTDPRGYQ